MAGHDFPLQDNVTRMIAAQSVETVWAIYANALSAMGWNKLLYGGTRMPANDRRIGDMRDALILQHGPQAYADIYFGEELYLHSPSYLWAATNTGFASWAEAENSYTGPPRPEHLQILQLNAKFDVRGGYVGSLNETVRGMHGVIGMSPTAALNQAQTDAMWAEMGRDIEMLSNLLQLRIASLPISLTRRPLTSRQRDALGWFAEGKTTQDIAEIMGLSTGTIEKHLRMARDALDATTTAHAVQKAMRLNLLSA